MKYIEYPTSLGVSNFSYENLINTGFDLLGNNYPVDADNITRIAQKGVNGLDRNVLLENLRTVLASAGDKYPGSEIGDMLQVSNDGITHTMKLPVGDAVDTNIPLEALDDETLLNKNNYFAKAHTHPTVFSPKTITGIDGELLEQVDAPKYPSILDIATSPIFRQELNGRGINTLPYDYIATNEYGKPAIYEYGVDRKVFRNPIRFINYTQDIIRNIKNDQLLAEGIVNHDADLTKQAFLNRAAQEEYLSHVKNPYLHLERLGENITGDLPEYAPSRAGEVVAGLAGVGIAKNGFDIVKGIQQNRNYNNKIVPVANAARDSYLKQIQEGKLKSATNYRNMYSTSNSSFAYMGNIVCF